MANLVRRFTGTLRMLPSSQTRTVFSHNTSLVLNQVPACQQTVKTICHKCYQHQQWNSPQFSQVRWATSLVGHNDSLARKVLRQLGFQGKMKFKKSEMKRAGLRLYLCCAELVDYDLFFKEFELEDTFASWFNILELHIWMSMSRLAVEEREGTFVRDMMIQAMWTDVDKRSKRLGEGASAARREGIKMLSHQFKGSLYGYDEGLVGDDQALAGALWRNFFNMQCDDPRKVEVLVSYVHKQLRHLEYQESVMILRSGLMTFLPLYGNKLDEERNRQVLDEIIRRV